MKVTRVIHMLAHKQSLDGARRLFVDKVIAGETWEICDSLPGRLR